MEGVLCSEPIHAIRFDIVHAEISSKAQHRSAAQISTTVLRCMRTSMLTAAPRLSEPIYSVEITSSLDSVSGVYPVLSSRCAAVISQEPRLGTPIIVIKAQLSSTQLSGVIILP